jgi:large subunit ribosomal protein L18e
LRNLELLKTIKELKTAAKKTGKPIWAALAEELERSKRNRVAVNLSTIERHTGEGEIVAVPGKVLASGILTHPVTVAAFDFSGLAKQKILSSKGEVKSLTQLLTEGVDASKVKILK